jgi:ADP-ribose pyrophosphatase
MRPDNDSLYGISGLTQRYGQGRPKIPCSHNDDARLGGRGHGGSIADRVHYNIGCMAKSSSRSASSRAASSLKQRGKARLVSSRIVYRGPVFWVTTDHVNEPGGIRVRRDLIHHSGSVVVLAVDDSGATPRVLLERQYRHAAGDYLWELPAGRIDPGEHELKAAKRELLEETGYTAKHWKRILKFYASPGFVAETMSVFLATGLQAGEAQPEEDEVIYKRLVPLPTAVSMILKGTIRDAKTISGVLWLDHQSHATAIGSRTRK